MAGVQRMILSSVVTVKEYDTVENFNMYVVT